MSTTPPARSTQMGTHTTNSTSFGLNLSINEPKTRSKGKTIRNVWPRWDCNTPS